jgi:hypothetical protein
VQSGSNTLFRVGDGIADQRKFGTGAVLMTLTNASFASSEYQRQYRSN